jgi:hypothetical protein
MLSTYGHISANVVTSPRLLYSLAAEGDLPPFRLKRIIAITGTGGRRVQVK